MNCFSKAIVVLMIWLGACGRILACGPATSEEKYFGVLTGFPSDEVTSVMVDRKGNVYVGTEDKGLVVISAPKEKFTHIIDETQRLTFNAVHSLALGDGNNLWVGTAGGLNGVDLGGLSGSNVRIFAEDGLRDNICLSLAVSGTGSEVWVGTTKGLVTKSGFQRFTTDQGLIDNLVQSLFFDVDNNLWIGTARGLMRRAGFLLKPIELTPDSPALEHWVYGLSMPPYYALDYLDKVKKTFKAILKGTTVRDPRLNGIDSGKSHGDFVRFIVDQERKIGVEMSRGPLYVATSNGCYAVDRFSGASEPLREGWHTSIAANSYGGSVGAGRDLIVHPLGLEEEVLRPFDLRPLIKRNILQILEEYQSMSPEEKEEKLPPAALALLDGIGGSSSEDFAAFGEKFLAGKMISSMFFSPLGHLWVGVKGGGLFRFKPIVLNHDTFSFAILHYNRLLGEDQNPAPETGAAPSRLSEKPMKGFRLVTKPVDYPQVPEVTQGIAMCKSILPEVKEWWVGKWSQLNVADCQLLGEFSGTWAYDLCVMNLTRVLRFDPYVIIPLDVPEAPVPPGTAPPVASST
jgi:hypothetical protein